jgi:hypothetical protein
MEFASFLPDVGIQTAAPPLSFFARPQLRAGNPHHINCVWQQPKILTTSVTQEKLGKDQNSVPQSSESKVG